MTSSAFDNLSGPGKPLKPEPADATEFSELMRSGLARLMDGGKAELSLDSRFDLAYNASHALSLAALRWHGYRSSQRYVVFQMLPHTLGLGPDVWRVLAKGHELRNLGEYEGSLAIDERIVADLIAACHRVAERIRALDPLAP